jgi:hypothetical protein
MEIPEALLARFAEASSQLYRCAPWTMLSDTEVLGVDIPELGISDACLSVIGSAQDWCGFALFDDIEAYDNATHTLSLAFVEEEARLHRGDTSDMIEPRDVRIAIACAEALVSLLDTHADALGADHPPKLFHEASIARENVHVRLSIPHPEAHWGPRRSEGGGLAKYDGDIEPDSELWLATHERDREALVLEYHRELSENMDASHIAIHVAVETQLAAGTPPNGRAAVARLMKAGLSRHEAVHALGEVLEATIAEMERTGSAFDARRYEAALDAIKPTIKPTPPPKKKKS